VVKLRLGDGSPQGLQVVYRHHSYKGRYDRLPQLAEGDAGVLDAMPGFLEQETVLRIHRRRLAVADGEKLVVEPSDVVERSAPTADGFASVGQPSVERHRPHRHPPLPQVLPELPVVARARKPARHSDHRNVAG
jgi:hypothetical protein